MNDGSHTGIPSGGNPGRPRVNSMLKIFGNIVFCSGNWSTKILSSNIGTLCWACLDVFAAAAHDDLLSLVFGQIRP